MARNFEGQDVFDGEDGDRGYGRRGGYGGDRGGSRGYQRNARNRDGFRPSPGKTYLENVEMSCEAMNRLAEIAHRRTEETGKKVSVYQVARDAIDEYVGLAKPRERRGGSNLPY